MTRTITDVLCKTTLFGGLPQDALVAVQAAMRPATYSSGQVIFSRGDAGDGIYLVLEGRVRLSVITGEGRELTFAHATSGEVFGEIAVLDGSPRTADATAISTVRVHFLPSAAFEQLLARYPDFLRSIIRLLCSRLRTLSDHIEEIALLPIEARLARYLLNRIGGAGSCASPGGRRTVLGISQSELALLLGASRPKINSALMLLEREGAVVRSGLAIDCDPERLAKFARLT